MGNSTHTKAILKKGETKYMARIPQKELTEAMKELSNGAYKLLMYYYSQRDGWKFVDNKIATTIGTSERQLRKFRKELITKQYLLIQRGQVDVYFIGRLAVNQFICDTGNEEVCMEEPKDPVISQKI